MGNHCVNIPALEDSAKYKDDMIVLILKKQLACIE
ncbi:MAG: hypothetical protein JWR19_774 [Pedosphaera sp.]|nr:hypothetical protein [Pedosphaera sp.]